MKRSLKDVVSQVPVDYYEKGIKTNYFQRAWHRKKWGILKRYLKEVKGGLLLDIGCADGTTTKQIKRFLPTTKVTGVDYYKKAIIYARKRTKAIKFVIGDAHSLPFTGESFDVVTVIETLEHLDNPRKVLKEIHRVLKKNGLLILGQDTDSLLFKIVWFLWTRGKGSVWEGSHISCMRPNKLLKLIKDGGFKTKKVEYINFGMEVFVKSTKE